MDIRRPFTRADAIAAGISPRLLRGSRFRRLFRGVYISADVLPEPWHWHRIVAGLLIHPAGARASHLSAAVVYGIPVPDHSDVHISVVEDKDRRWQPGLKPHVSPPHVKTRDVDGIPVSEPIRMFVELASVLNLVDLVVAGDATVRVLKIKADELRAGLARTRDYWSPAARAAAAYVRDEVDSPMESRLRMLLVLAGLPEPRVNVKLRDDNGDVVARLDLGYPDVQLAVEYEGRQHIEDAGTWEDDIERREYLDGVEWRVIKVTARGVYVEPWRTIQRVADALRQRGVLFPPLSQDWRPFFPGHRKSRPA
jgi:very-short-patch-repair endonuclease